MQRSNTTLPPLAERFQRTIVLMELHSQPGQHVFIRGGISYERRPRTHATITIVFEEHGSPAATNFLSRVSKLTLDIDIAILSVCLSVCPSVRPSVHNTMVLYENGLTYRHSFFTVFSLPNHSCFTSIKHSGCISPS